jgi:hypothetical protein
MPQEFVAYCKLKGDARVNLRAAFFAGTLWLIAPVLALAAEMMPGVDSMVVDPGAPPMSEMGGGSYFFAQDLGTMLRVQYRTESYGQDNESGNLDIGTMQMINFDDAAVFFDGQVTLNDPNGVGFNVGVGYRWMSFQSFASSPGIMQGVSIWADGTNTEADNFFPQIGLSYESLGEMWDLRANGYIPVGQDTQMGDFEQSGGGLGFQGNSIVQLTQATIDQSFYVGEAEFARRITRDRDAWAFAGPYFLANDSNDTLGYRAGLRGYAYPDLLLQIAVSDDDIFDTNAAFTLIWFVGRTRTHFRPACGVPDRFREPVMRNDYVALAQSSIGGGEPLTDAGGEELRIVHVSSNAAPGGDGTFENPFDMLTDANNAGSLEGDIILVHSNSVFSGQNVILKNDQRLLGEGLDADGEPLVHTVVTFEQGTIDIPESSPGARELPRPQINDAADDAVTLAATGNEVANFDFDGGNSAIVGTGLTGSANLHDLGVTDTNEFAISLTDTATTSTITLDDFIYDGGATGGGVELSNFDGTFNATNSELANGTQEGLFVHNNGMGDISDGTITFANTVTFESVDANPTAAAVHVDGFTGVLAVNGDITNDTGLSTEIENISLAGTSVTFGGVITDTGDGLRVHNNSGGAVRFNGNVTLDTEASDAVVLDTNTGAEIDFGGVLDIGTTSTGDAFLATGGGTLTADNPNNVVATETGQLAFIQGMTVSSTGVFFDRLNRSVAGATTNAIQLENNTGGPITLGRLTAASGTIEGGTVDAIRIENSADVAINQLTINNNSAVAGVRVVRAANAMTLDLSDLVINNGSVGIDVSTSGVSTAALNMQIFDNTINNPTADGLRIDGITAGTTTVANLEVNATGADAVELTNNTGATLNFSDLDVQTTTGRGFVATGGGTLAATGAGNTIVTTTGTGLELRNMTIAGTGAAFQSVNVNGATNAVIMQNLTGGQVTVGSTTGGASVLSTTGDTIMLENVANADFNNVDVTSSGGRGVFANHLAAPTGAMDITFNDLNLMASGGLGVDVDGASAQQFNLRINNSTIADSVDIDSTGSGAFKVLLDNADITTTGTDVALSLTFADTGDGDLTIRNGSTIMAANARALDMAVNNAGTTVAVLIESSTFTSATLEDLFLDNTVGAQTDATIRNNTFSNSAAANDVVISSTGSAGAGTRIDLNLVGNGAPASTIFLNTDDDAVAPFNFGVVDRDNVDANNSAAVILNPLPANFEDIDVSDVELPNGP